MVGNQVVEQIKENINAIKAKQTVAEKYADTANKRLEVYFDEQKKEVSRIMQKYNEALESYLNDYETMLKERKTELESRNREFVEAIDRKLSIEDIRSDFKALREIPHQLEMLMRNPVDGGNERMNAQNETADANRRAGEAESKSKFRKVEEEQRPIIDGEKRTGQFQNEKDKILAQIKQEEEKDKMVMEIINEARNSSSQNIVSERTTTDSVQETENVEEPKKKKWFKRLFKR